MEPSNDSNDGDSSREPISASKGEHSFHEEESNTSSTKAENEGKKNERTNNGETSILTMTIHHQEEGENEEDMATPLLHDDPPHPEEDNNHASHDTKDHSITTHAPVFLPTIIQRQPPIHAKVKIHLIAVGSAPILKKSKFLLSSNVTFGTLQQRLRKMLHMSHDDYADPLYLYIQQSFVPSPDDWLGDLNDLYSVRNVLQVHYSLTEAWG